MKEIAEDFVSKEKKDFKWALGKVGASALSGFLAGLAVAAIFFFTVFDMTLK
jgi:hypothetical protein